MVYYGLLRSTYYAYNVYIYINTRIIHQYYCQTCIKNHAMRIILTITVMQSIIVIIITIIITIVFSATTSPIVHIVSTILCIPYQNGYYHYSYHSYPYEYHSFQFQFICLFRIFLIILILPNRPIIIIIITTIIIIMMRTIIFRGYFFSIELQFF